MCIFYVNKLTCQLGQLLRLTGDSRASDREWSTLTPNTVENSATLYRTSPPSLVAMRMSMYDEVDVQRIQVQRKWPEHKLR